ncbi:hypothetical protein G6F59_014013 [Rhizopus arrhizus]|nr:hypothetical protein G6F59_014013 [Rhizopus arrhizus]
MYYTGQFDVDNADGRLRSYMTAQVRIVLGRAKGVLTIPSAALGARATDGSYNVQERGSAQWPAGRRAGGPGPGRRCHRHRRRTAMTGAEKDTPLLRVRGIRREFAAGEQTLVVLDGIDLDIRAGERVAIVGQSGSGKSTLMNILGCLDRPSAGAYQIAGRETAQMSPDELAALRREHFGFIFQRYHLLSDLTAQGNVEMPAVYAGKRREARMARAEEFCREASSSA